ncbi:hypothetical protein MMC07_009945 [Pseudocyphellaria aurata]|nr:hypothetical protein [Pseudocyphellaria aurata]
MAPTARTTKAGHRTATMKSHSAPPKGKTKQAEEPTTSSRLPAPPADPSAIAGPVDSHELSDIRNRIERARALHAKWIFEDRDGAAESSVVDVPHQQSRCRDIGLVVFGFVLHEAQVEAIRTLFYEQTDLLLLAKTGFDKSLIFQLVPFMTSSTGVALVLMLLKLLQAEQSDLINRRIPSGKAIVLNGDNNTPRGRDPDTGGYTHMFTSPEIALSKQFKDEILARQEFTDRLCLLAIDEIHLTDEWGQKFRPLYAEISKVRKRIPCQVPLLGVSATLTKRVQKIAIEKAGYLPNYRLMQTLLDRPEIMQIHCSMQYPKASCLDLQLIFPEAASQARDIQKTIVFVNSVAEIFPMVDIIQS